MGEFGTVAMQQGGFRNWGYKSDFALATIVTISKEKPEAWGTGLVETAWGNREKSSPGDSYVS
jgi:hypothetical protein